MRVTQSSRLMRESNVGAGGVGSVIIGPHQVRLPSKDPSLLEQEQQELKTRRHCYEMPLLAVIALTTLASIAMFLFAIAVRHKPEFVLHHALRPMIEAKRHEVAEMYNERLFMSPITTSQPILHERSVSAEEAANRTEEFDEVHVPPMWVKAENARDVFFGRWVRMFTDILLTNVLMLWSTTISGWLLIHESNPVFIYFFMMISLVDIAIEGISAEMFLFHFKNMKEGLKRDLTVQLIKNYNMLNDGPFERVANSIMIVGECCGVNGPQDFDIASRIAGGEHFVPQACCKVDQWGTYRSDKPRLLSCVSDRHLSMGGVVYDARRINPQGCFDVWRESWYDYSHVAIYTFVGVLGAIQLVQAILGYVVLRYTARIIRLDKELLQTSSTNTSQEMVSGLRETTYSEMFLSTFWWNKRPQSTEL